MVGFSLQALMALGSQVRKAGLSEISVSPASVFFLHSLTLPEEMLAGSRARQDPFHRSALCCGSGVGSQSVGRDWVALAAKGWGVWAPSGPFSGVQ